MDHYLDEEIGGEKGMMAFTKMDDFKSMNVGFALDEGMHTVHRYFALHDYCF